MRRSKNRKLTEERLVTKDFYCGPGIITTWYKNDFGEYDETSDIFDPDFASTITYFVRKNCDEDLAQYFDGDGIDSIYFDEVVELDHHYYMLWKVTYDPVEVSEETIIEYLTGQMSDGWGECFEQYPFGSDTFEELESWEEEEPDGTTSSQNDYVQTEHEYFYSPWNRNTFDIIVG